MMRFRWGGRNPFEDMLSLQQEMQRVVQGWQPAVAGPFPPVNLYDDGTTFHLRAEVPGLNKEKLDVSVAGDVLTFKGERQHEEQHGSFHRRERGWEAFNRSLTLPDTIDVDNVRATYKEGVLEVTLPRAPEARPRKVSIETR
jgi:HSP20 family protein